MWVACQKVYPMLLLHRPNLLFSLRFLWAVALTGSLTH